MLQQINKQKARDKFEKEYAGGVVDGIYFKKSHLLKFSPRERKRLKIAEEFRLKKIEKMRVRFLIEKLRTVDKQTLQKIGEQVGLSGERIRQILLNK